MRHLVKQLGYVLYHVSRLEGHFQVSFWGQWQVRRREGQLGRSLSLSLEGGGGGGGGTDRQTERKRKLKKQDLLRVPGLFVSITDLAEVSPRHGVRRYMAGSSGRSKTARSFRNYTFFLPMIDKTRVWQTAAVYGYANGCMVELQHSTHIPLSPLFMHSSRRFVKHHRNADCVTDGHVIGVRCSTDKSASLVSCDTLRILKPSWSDVRLASGSIWIMTPEKKTFDLMFSFNRQLNSDKQKKHFAVASDVCLMMTLQYWCQIVLLGSDVINQA